MGISEFSGKPDETLQGTSIPPGGTSDTPILSSHYSPLFRFHGRPLREVLKLVMVYCSIPFYLQT